MTNKNVSRLNTGGNGIFSKNNQEEKLAHTLSKDFCHFSKNDHGNTASDTNGSVAINDRHLTYGNQRLTQRPLTSPPI